MRRNTSDHTWRRRFNLAGMKTVNCNRFLPNAKPESRRRSLLFTKAKYVLKQEEAPLHLPTRLCAEGKKRLQGKRKPKRHWIRGAAPAAGAGGAGIDWGGRRCGSTGEGGAGIREYWTRGSTIWGGSLEPLGIGGGDLFQQVTTTQEKKAAAESDGERGRSRVRTCSPSSAGRRPACSESGSPPASPLLADGASARPRLPLLPGRTRSAGVWKRERGRRGGGGGGGGAGEKKAAPPQQR
jgi:hypothetical protein